ncbi:MAG: SagB/ThcOx family dehydrogenase [Geobacteraceae bacterium]|nr:SagB/ThcOx family dehydrogenase [Geobacteraceae bacterium]
MRVNPSSGNLHPTECYILCGTVSNLCTAPMVCHYTSKEHRLEVRAEISQDVREKLTEGLPERTVFVGLSSIHWRESWKYGERVYRYCQLDVGHALAALALSAAALGWEARLLDDLGSDLLGDYSEFQNRMDQMRKSRTVCWRFVPMEVQRVVSL